MGVLDKIKNALFEVEYVEVDEPPKKEKNKEKKEKNKSKDKEKKPIAKKVVLPGRKEEKIEEIKEEELADDNFEIRPKDEIKKEMPGEQFKFMDDKDFQVDSDFPVDEPEILQVLDDTANHTNDLGNKEKKITTRFTREEKNVKNYHDYYDEDSFMYDSYSSNSKSSLNETKPYGMDKSMRVSVPEYGVYEKKEEKVYFQPSPIISPIYGILDKNYRKEDVQEKKEVRITTNYSRSNVSVDDVRNKAYGPNHDTDNEPIQTDDVSFEEEEDYDDDDNLLVDLSDKAKPEVKELTMGDALEYFQDLGLEYNVDYVDVSGKDKKNVKKETLKRESKTENDVENAKHVNNKKNKSISSSNKSKLDTKNIEEDNDNLFDLIDSMYQESD